MPSFKHGNPLLTMLAPEAFHDAAILALRCRRKVVESGRSEIADHHRIHGSRNRAARANLERAGTYDAMRKEALAALREGNEDPEAFHVSSPYRVLEISRST